MICTYLLKHKYSGNSKNPPTGNYTFFSHPCTRPVGFPSCQTVPIPVPTQIQNYQRLKQNLQPVGCTRYMKLLHCIGVRSWLIAPLPQSISVFTGPRSVVLNLPMQQLNVPDHSSYPQQVSFPADFWLLSHFDCLTHQRWSWKQWFQNPNVLFFHSVSDRVSFPVFHNVSPNEFILLKN